MHRGTCFSCGYCTEEKDYKGDGIYYCNDRDCYIDPYDPECNYDDDNDD